MMTYSAPGQISFILLYPDRAESLQSITSALLTDVLLTVISFFMYRFVCISYVNISEKDKGEKKEKTQSLAFRDIVCLWRQL